MAERFVGGTSTPRAGAAAISRISRFIGNDPAAHSIARGTFDRVALGEVYPGIDVELRAAGFNVEKVFTVAPGSDPGRIAMSFDDASDMEVGDDGSLRVTSRAGTLAFTPPVAYQAIDGVRTSVFVRYRLHERIGTYGFIVGDYNASEPLIIDPLLQATYLGGTHDDRIAAIAIDPLTGDVIVAGASRSVDLPCAAEASSCGPGAQVDHASDGGTYDGFVARLTANLTQLKQVTYLGGNGEDRITAVAIHPVSGEVLVAGRTKSTDLPCTTALGACGTGAQVAHANDTGNFDGFVMRLSPDLSQLRQTTYLGGNGDDAIFGLTIHNGTDEAVVAGRTTSTNLPCTTAASAGCANAAQTTHADSGASADGFVTRMSADLTQFRQTTYVGGNGQDILSALIVYPSTGDIVAAGMTSSTNLPCTTLVLGCANAAQPNFAGVQDGLVLRLSPDLTQFKQLTYIGGTGNDFLTSLVVQNVTGAILVGGYTESTDLPCTTAGGLCGNAAQAAHATALPLDADGFVARLSSDLTQLYQSTYFGGGGFEFVAGLAVHPLTDELWAAGGTASTNLPCTEANATCSNGIQMNWDGIGGSIGFVVRFSPDLRRFQQATYLGDDNEITTLAMHPLSGEIVIAGNTVSTTFPCTTDNPPCANGAQPGYAGGALNSFDGFVARLTPDLSASDGTPDPFTFAGRANAAPLSMQTSMPAKITGIEGSVGVSVSGVLGATYCINTVPDCSCTFVSTPGSVDNNQYACVRHMAPAVANAENFSLLQVGPAAARFYVSTGAPFATGCSLDVDNNGLIRPLSDGLIVIRAMFGLTGTSVTNGAVGIGAQRDTWEKIRSYLNSNCGTQFAP